MLVQSGTEFTTTSAQETDMKRSVLAALAAVGCLLFVLVWVGRQPTVAQQPAKPVQKWEYTVRQVQVFGNQPFQSPSVNPLNEVGQAGWELCHTVNRKGIVNGQEQHFEYYIFKRPLQK
jgi:hypothetical protein